MEAERGRVGCSRRPHPCLTPTRLLVVAVSLSLGLSRGEPTTRVMAPDLTTVSNVSQA